MRFGFIAFVFISFLIGSAFGVGGNLGGASQNGSSANPWLIEDLADFNAFAGNTAYWASGVHVRLECDLNFSTEGTFSKAPIAGESNSTTSGFDGTEYSGCFDGNGRTISNLIVEGDDFCGLFGKVGTDGSVTNLGLENISITSEASSNNIGGLAGMCRGSITNCYSTGSVSGGNRYAGGLTGYNNGSIIRCYSTCSVSGDEYVGGLVGRNSSAYIISSFSTSSVNGSTYVGGLAGYNYPLGHINNSYSASSVNGISSVGGLTGRNSGSITNCYSYGAVAGTGDDIGGFTGSNISWSTAPTVIYRCFWNIETSGIGDPEGGLNGTDTDDMKGMTTAEMENISNYIDAGWDFTGENANGMHQLWQMPGERGFPQLSCFNEYTPVVLSGDGTETNPYLINNAIELSATIHYGPKACYELQSDIDLNGTKLSIAPVPYLSGSFDGNGHVIENAEIEGSGFLGIFGYIGASAAVDDLGAVNCNISSLFFNTGGLAGYNCGQINNCYSTGSIEGNSYVGGLVGHNYEGYINRSYSSCNIKSNNNCAGGLVGYNESGSIAMSYSIGHIDGNARLGGFVGINHGSINSCYSTGQAVGNSYVGGLAGENLGDIINSYSSGQAKGRFDYLGGFCATNSGSINNCYSTGSVTLEWNSYVGGFCGDNLTGVITNSFWDTDSSGFIWSDGGVGKTTLEMQTKSTFTGSGWSFYSIDEEASEWQMPTGRYPRLIWETSLDYDGEMTLIFNKNMQGQINFEIFNIKTESINWILTGHEQCQWITEISPVSGNSTGASDRTNVTISINSMGMDAGLHTCDLILSNDGGADVVCPVRFEIAMDGSGTADDPYLIDSLGALDLFADPASADTYWASGVYTKLTCDLDLSGRIYDTAVISPDIPDTGMHFDGVPFEGVFDGDGHVISNITIEVTDPQQHYLGLFGTIGKRNGEARPVVKKLGMENVEIIGLNTTKSVSGLCAESFHGTISECYVTGAIAGHFIVGGLCGYNYQATIIDSYSACSVTGLGGAVWSGGLCGGNQGGTITNCYASGIVTDDTNSENLGGLYGIGDAPVSSFWDTQSCGTSDGAGYTDPDPAGVVGLTTDQMQTVSTFTNAGWDFVGEDINGSDDVWQLLVDGSWYPRLAWEFSAGDFVGSDGVDMSDFAYFAEWYNCDGDCRQADLDGDGVVGLLDLSVFCSHWLEN